MDDNIDLEIIKAITEFPIGKVAQTQHELLCKAAVVSFLAQYQEQFYIEATEGKNISEGVQNCLRDVFMLEDDEVIPDVSTAERYLKLSKGFVQDYSKVQQIKASNPKFGATYNLISAQMKNDLFVKNYTK